MPNPQIAVAWLEVEDWARWREIDPTLHFDYSQYALKLAAVMEKMRDAGYNLTKVGIKPDEFLAWSAANGGRVDAAARTNFAASRLLRDDTSS